MTYLEAITEDLQPYPIRKSLVVRQCYKQGLIASETVTDEKAVSLCVVEILSQMVILNNVSEGGVAVSFNKEAVNQFIKRKCYEIGIDSVQYVEQPTVTRIE